MQEGGLGSGGKRRRGKRRGGKRRTQETQGKGRSAPPELTLHHFTEARAVKLPILIQQRAAIRDDFVLLLRQIDVGRARKRLDCRPELLVVQP